MNTHRDTHAHEDAELRETFERVAREYGYPTVESPPTDPTEPAMTAQRTSDADEAPLRVTLYGPSSPIGEADLLALTVDWVDELGVGDVDVRVSHRGVLTSLLDAFGADVDTEAALRATATHDAVESDDYLEALVDAGLNYGQADKFGEMLRVDADSLDALAELTASAAVREPTDDLRSVLDAAAERGVREQVRVSLPAVGRGTYSGFVVECTVPSADETQVVANGGRLDTDETDEYATPVAGLTVDPTALANSATSQ